MARLSEMRSTCRSLSVAEAAVFFSNEHLSVSEGRDPMAKIDEYRTQLRGLKDWKPFLLKASGLPGPRGNLELAHAFCLEASKKPDS